ncbi:hypothetical protein G4B88_005580 [Cannabis sativa]|uniref:Uncharacterized protein n=2 Tax=Cannabis sativa TaxID=3483 RepID=A0A7J6H8V6_CANSA|nr:hypothetical protein G4B88_005580 [Cannabis sativa]
MKIPVIGFQVLLCMRLEGTPSTARKIPLPILFSPLFLLQGVGVLAAASRLVEKIVLLLRTGASTGAYFRFSSRAHDCLGFLHHGSRLLGWWSIDEGSCEEQARLYQESASGSGDFKQPWGNRQKSLNTANKSSKDSKMKKFYAGFASREKSVWSCCHAGIAFFAVLAARSAKNVQYAAFLSSNDYLYMMFNLASSVRLGIGAYREVGNLT